MAIHETAALRMKIIEGAVLSIIDDGASRLSSQAVADLAGVDVEEVEQQFPTKDSMLATVVEHWAGAISDPLLPLADSHGAVSYMQALVRAFSFEPQLMRLLATVLGASTDPDAPGASYYQTIYARFAATIRDALRRDVESGREPSTMQPERGAQQLLALYDGLRMQSLLLPGQHIVPDFDRAVTRLRRGWSEPYEIDTDEA